MPRDKLDDFIDLCSGLDPHNFAADAANEYYRTHCSAEKVNTLGFVLSSYYLHGRIIVESLKPGKLHEYCNNMAEENYEIYGEEYDKFPVDESYATPEKFEEVMRFYINFLLTKLEKALSEGYDWSVLMSMTRLNLSGNRVRALVSICE